MASLAGALQRRSFDKGQMVVERLESSHDVYFLTKGRVVTVFWTEDGREIGFGRVMAGGQFGEVAAIDGQPRSLSVYSQTPAEALVLKRADFLRMLDDCPIVRAQAMTGMAALVRQLTDRVHHLTSLRVDQRVRAHLVRLALQEAQFHPGGILRDPPTHAEIANAVGANREAVSRVLSRLNRAGLIDSGRQSIRFLAPDELMAN